MNEVSEIVQVTRGVLVVDGNPQGLIEELRDRDIIIVEILPDTDEDTLKRHTLPDRILVTNNSKDFIMDATSFVYKIISTDKMRTDAKSLAKVISDAIIKYGLWHKRHSWILTLSPDGNHKLKNLID